VVLAVRPSPEFQHFQVNLELLRVRHFQCFLEILDFQVLRIHQHFQLAQETRSLLEVQALQLYQVTLVCPQCPCLQAVQSLLQIPEVLGVPEIQENQVHPRLQLDRTPLYLQVSQPSRGSQYLLVTQEFQQHH